jgi:hypothetical protein
MSLAIHNTTLRQEILGYVRKFSPRFGFVKKCTWSRIGGEGQRSRKLAWLGLTDGATFLPFFIYDGKKKGHAVFRPTPSIHLLHVHCHSHCEVGGQGKHKAYKGHSVVIQSRAGWMKQSGPRLALMWCLVRTSMKARGTMTEKFIIFSPNNYGSDLTF